MTPTVELGRPTTAITLEDVLVTEALRRRPAQDPDYPAEIAALQTLARCLAEEPAGMLPRLLEIAIDLCGAGTAGLSLVEQADTGHVFRWVNVAGALSAHVGGSTPRDFSPCGVCLDRGAPQLFSYPGRYFTYFQAASPEIVEGLVIPIRWNDEALGTIWIVSHDDRRLFDLEDVRVMESLASFTGAALCVRAARAAAEREAAHTVREQERSQWVRRLIDGQEDERRRIARELHDEMSQHLTCLTLGLHAIEHAADARARVGTIDRLQVLVSTIDRGIHDLLRDLRPAALDDLGLASALNGFADEWSSHHGIACECACPPEEARLPAAVETTVYRIVQEALTNVARHARAHHASVVVNRDTDRVTLMVEDDGGGFDVEGAGTRPASPRLGLIGIRERASLLGGTATIESSAAGTVVFVTLPLTRGSIDG